MISQCIIAQLNKFFPDYDIYGEKVRQGFEEPCFFVQILPSKQEKELQSYRREEMFDIQYFLDEFEEDANAKYEAMGNQLFQILEYLPIADGKLLRGLDMSYQIIDDVLHFNVRYEFAFHDIATAEKMKALDIKESVKNGESEK